jgi:hypothetical protein
MMLRRKIVTQRARYFADKLNDCLDDMDAPPSTRERAIILSKMLDIPKQEAFRLLQGSQPPAPELLQKLASEFDIDMKWLSGDK